MTNTDKYPPRSGDLSFQELSQRAYPLVKMGHIVFVKWTCPDCGERVTSDTPLYLVKHEGRECVAFPPGYNHTEKDDHTNCGRLVRIHEHKFGFTVIATNDPMKLRGLFPSF